MHAPRLIAVVVGAMVAMGATSYGGAESVAAPRADTPSCPDAKTRPGKLSRKQARTAIVCLINRTRERHGLPSVSRDARLRRAAQRHNRRMHGTGCWSHQCPGEASLEARLRDAGYLTDGLTRWIGAENLAWGAYYRGTPARILDAWMHSPGHRHTILTGELRDIGVGFHRGTPWSKRTRGVIFTTDFGLRVP